MTATLELELAASSVAGYDEPRFMCAPSADLPTRAVEAIELAASAGIELDDWEKLVLVESLRMRASKWAAFEVGVNVPRQNGKNVVLEVREAAGLFCWGERLLQHSAHLFDTSLESFRRLEDFIEAANLGHLVKRVMRSHGEEGFELKTKQRIRFRTRTKGGGRGMTGDTVIFDEAMMLDRLAVRALLPTLTAVANPQVWYTGSAVDQEATQHGHVFADVRRRGLDAEPRLAYFEWSARIGDPEKDNPDELTDELMADVETWAQANPALGIRISQGYLEAEHTALDSRSFAVERLGIGDWPQPDAFDSVIPMERWDELADPASVLIDSPTFVYDVSDERKAWLTAACRRPDGRFHAEIVRSEPGTDWLADDLRDRGVTKVFCDGYGPAASVIRTLEAEGIEVEPISGAEHPRACGALLDLIDQDALRHRAQGELRRALKGAKVKTFGDAWVWSRRYSAVDVSPLIASTLALWLAGALAEAEPEILVAVA